MKRLGARGAVVLLALAASQGCSEESAPVSPPAVRVVEAPSPPPPPSPSPPPAPEEPGCLSGRVLDDRGAPMKGIRVRAFLDPWKRGRPWFTEAFTGEDGRFIIRGLADEAHRVRALRSSEEDHFEATLSSESLPGVVPPRSDLVLVLRTPGRIEGRLVAKPGSPLGGLRVFVDALEGEDAKRIGERIEFQSWETGKDLAEDEHPGRVIGRMHEDIREVAEDGRFDSSPILPGRYRVVVDDVRALPATAEGVVPAGGSVSIQVPVRLRGDAEVRVTDPAGNPIAAASVDFLDGKGEPLPALYERTILGRFGGMYSNAAREEAEESLATDERGVAVRRYLDPGPARLRVRQSGYAQHLQIVEVPEGTSVAVAVTLAMPKAGD